MGAGTGSGARYPLPAQEAVRSTPSPCARYGFVDEIVNLAALRGYLKAFAGAVYQNPESICPRHLMMLPRLIRG